MPFSLLQVVALAFLGLSMGRSSLCLALHMAFSPCVCCFLLIRAP